MNISNFLVDIAKPLAAKALVGLGFGTVTYVGLTAALNAAVSAAQGAVSGLTGDIAAILAIGGFFEAFGIIAGGLVASVTLVSLKNLQMKTS